MSYFVDFWKRYVDFKGRTSRKSFWMTILFLIILYVVVMIVDRGLDAAINGTWANWLTFLVGLATIIPSISLSVRRLHDTDKSGWFWLLNFVPFGNIVLLVFYFMAGTPGKNKYGEPEKMEKKAAA